MSPSFMRLLITFIIFGIGVSSAQSEPNENQVWEFPRGRHGLEHSCNHGNWKSFDKDRSILLELIQNVDSKATTEELNILIWEIQEEIIAKNYSDICYFHQYLQCTLSNICACVEQAPPFNFQMVDGECRGRRGALCDPDGEGEGHYACKADQECKLALAGNTAICGGKAAFYEELENFRSKNGGFQISPVFFTALLAILSLLLKF